MYDLAKKSRESMKSKARRLAGEKDQKVDSSDWSPAPLLRAEMKTGARPITKPSSKGIGESNKAADTKAALGSAHRGAFKDGGGVFDKKALGAIDPRAKRAAAQNYKKGGRAKKADGGFIDDIANALAGKGYIDGSTWLSGEKTPDRETTASIRRSRPSAGTLTPAQAKRELAMGRQNMRAARREDDLTSEQAARELEMGKKNLGIGRLISSNESGIPGAKKGGKVKKTKRADGGRLPSPYEAMRSEERRGTIKVEEKRKLPSPQEAAKSGARTGDVPEGRKKGGKVVKRATGGRTKAKPSISINILTGSKSPAPEAPPMVPPRIPPAPMPQMQGPPPGAVAPAPMPNVDPRNIQTPGARQAPIALKTGGRVTKVAKSYKDMEAGAVTGEGRLQKTDIAKLRKGAPARKDGGRISKVAKSYKDMTAGAGDGEGRLQKTDIAKAKKGRAA